MQYGLGRPPFKCRGPFGFALTHFQVSDGQWHNSIGRFREPVTGDFVPYCYSIRYPTMANPYLIRGDKGFTHYPSDIVIVICWRRLAITTVATSVFYWTGDCYFNPQFRIMTHWDGRTHVRSMKLVALAKESSLS